MKAKYYGVSDDIALGEGLTPKILFEHLILKNIHVINYPNLIALSALH